MSNIIDQTNINKKPVDSLKNNKVIYSSDLHKDALLTPQKSYKKEEKHNDSFNWLTEHSRNFLSAGYISAEITPETRIMEIAKRAEDILGISGYAKKFYNYMSKGFFSL